MPNLEPWISLGIHEVRWVFLFLFDTCCSTLSTPYLGLTSVVPVSSSLCLCLTIYFWLQFHLWVTHFLAKLEVSFFGSPWADSMGWIKIVACSFLFYFNFLLGEFCWSVLVTYPINYTELLNFELLIVLLWVVWSAIDFLQS